MLLNYFHYCFYLSSIKDMPHKSQLFGCAFSCLSNHLACHLLGNLFLCGITLTLSSFSTSLSLSFGFTFSLCLFLLDLGDEGMDGFSCEFGEISFEDGLFEVVGVDVEQK